MSMDTARSVYPHVPSAGGRPTKTALAVPSQGEWSLSVSSIVGSSWVAG